MILHAKSCQWLEPKAFRAKELIVLYIPPFPPFPPSKGGQGGCDNGNQPGWWLICYSDFQKMNGITQKTNYLLLQITGSRDYD